MAKLTRTKQVYDLRMHSRFKTWGTNGRTGGGTAEFRSGTEHFRLDVAAWRDMGEPKQITVTIEPGDTLTECPAVWTYKNERAVCVKPLGHDGSHADSIHEDADHVWGADE